MTGQASGGSDRGDNDFEVISWDKAFELMEQRLGKLRETDLKKFAMFTGRDQMQALTSMFAKQFGTPNYADTADSVPSTWPPA